MIYKFRVLSDEIELFARTIEIQETATFLALHEAIQASVGYDSSQLASFYIADKNWDRGEQITLLDMSDGEEKILFMSEEILKDHCFEVESNLVYVFDFFNNRAFYVTLAEIKDEEKERTYPSSLGPIGEAPEQVKLDAMVLEMEALEGEYNQSVESGLGGYEDCDDDIFGGGNWESLDDLENY